MARTRFPRAREPLPPMTAFRPRRTKGRRLFEVAALVSLAAFVVVFLGAVRGV